MYDKRAENGSVRGLTKVSYHLLAGACGPSSVVTIFFAIVPALRPETRLCNSGQTYPGWTERLPVSAPVCSSSGRVIFACDLLLDGIMFCFVFFQALCVVDERNLLVATVQLPVNMYSKWVCFSLQRLRFIKVPGTVKVKVAHHNFFQIAGSPFVW